MKRIFLDANIIIDYMDASSSSHQMAVDVMSIIRKSSLKPYVSPITFVIANHVLGKFIKNKSWFKNYLHLTFSAFEFTGIRSSFLDAIMKTHFTDLEDALQHECALMAGAHIILTKNTEDFFDSKIPVAHPADFVRRYNNLLSSGK